MYQDNKIWIGSAGNKKVYIYPKMANRHGMIAGATGTGKTVSLKVLAESFSNCGVPVFMADVKGDLSGICKDGIENESIARRIDALGLMEEGFFFRGCPTAFWDIYGEKGLPLRTTISEMGPLLLAKIMGLNDTQSAILSIVFKIADDEELLLIDTKDLRSMLQYVGENAKEYTLRYGNISTASLGAIARALTTLESEGGEMFFGEPALNIGDWFCTDTSGRGTIQILDCQRLINNPTMYSTFMLWLMSELFEVLPEAGDLEKPKMVFFFDEAHLLFNNASKELLGKVEQVVKLIRSKGVGIYFITQNPKDIPNGVLSQLGNKIQHALHAYTPSEQKAAKACSQSFRENPEFNTYETLLQLGIGEALVSVLDENGIPTMVERCTILPPQSLMSPLDDEEREKLIQNHLLYVRYSRTEDRDSAYEFLQRKFLADAESAQMAKETAAAEKQRLREEAAAKKAAEKKDAAKDKRVKSAAKNVASSAAGTIGREIGNSVGSSIGGKFGKKLGGNLGASLGRNLLGTLFGK